MAQVAAVVVAAGRGKRAGGDLPKQFRRIGGDTMLRRTLSLLVQHPAVNLVQPVIHRDESVPHPTTECLQISPYSSPLGSAPYFTAM